MPPGVFLRVCDTTRVLRDVVLVLVFVLSFFCVLCTLLVLLSRLSVSVLVSWECCSPGLRFLLLLFLLLPLPLTLVLAPPSLFLLLPDLDLVDDGTVVDAVDVVA